MPQFFDFDFRTLYVKELNSAHKGIEERQKNVSIGMVMERPTRAPRAPVMIINLSGKRM